MLLLDEQAAGAKLDVVVNDKAVLKVFFGRARHLDTFDAEHLLFLALEQLRQPLRARVEELGGDDEAVEVVLAVVLVGLRVR